MESGDNAERRVHTKIIYRQRERDQFGKNSLKVEFLGRIFLGYQGPTRRDIPDPGPGISRTKTLRKVPVSVVLDTEWPGCPAIWVGTCRDQKHSRQHSFGLMFRSQKEREGGERERERADGESNPIARPHMREKKTRKEGRGGEET